MDNNLKKIFKGQWGDVWNKTEDKRTHAAQINNIIKLVNFDCFIDCGVGYAGSESWSVRDNKPETTIIGFEPHHQRYEYLSNVKYPGDLFKLGVGKTEGIVEGFMGYEGGKSDFWLYGSEKLIEDGHYKKDTIELTTIDVMLSKYPSVKEVFIWADIEGAELDMIMGSVESMKNGKIVGFNLELRSHRADEGHCTGQEVIDILDEYGFKNLNGKPTSQPQDFIFIKK